MISASVWHEVKFYRSPALLFCNAGFDCLRRCVKIKLSLRYESGFLFLSLRLGMMDRFFD